MNKKPDYVEKAEKDMEFEVNWNIQELQNYADRNHIERDFIFETYRSIFNKRIREVNNNEKA